MFVAVLEAGSFVGAAARRGTSSGQASKLVSRLEAELGVRLLNRTTRAVSPTEAGRAYYERIRPLLDEFDSLDMAVRDISRSPRGRLRLTAPLTFGVTELVPALNRFAAEYGEIELDVSLSDRMVNLVDEGFDMAVRAGHAGDTTLIARRLCTTRLMVVGAPAYLERGGEPAHPDDLAGHACIIDTNGREPQRWPFRDRDGTPIVTAVSGRIRYANAEACVAAAGAGLGLACVPSFVAGPAVRAERVRPLLADFAPPPFAISALYPHSRHLAAKVRVLVDFLARHFQGTPHWDRLPGN